MVSPIGKWWVMDGYTVEVEVRGEVCLLCVSVCRLSPFCERHLRDEFRESLLQTVLQFRIGNDQYRLFITRH